MTMRIRPDSLLAWMPQSRWFGDKGRTLEGVRMIDEIVVDDGPPALVMALICVDLAGHGSSLYHVPLLVDEDGTARDAVESPERLTVFGELMAHGHALKGNAGAVEFGGPGLDPMSPPGSSAARLLGREQTNTSVVLDDACIVKLFRRVHPGPNPDLELGRLLTNEGFPFIPAHVGEAVYRGESDGEDLTLDLAIAQQFIGDAVEGWTGTLEGLRELFDAVDEADAREDLPFLTEQRTGSLLDRFAELGEVTGALHVTLSRNESNPDLAPEPIVTDDLEAWTTSALGSLELLAATPRSAIGRQAEAIRGRILDARRVNDPGMKTRVHGDYHLGQVIRSLRWMILDFEGEPARPLEQRRQKTSPIKDVAGMLRSFSYAASAALMERGQPGSSEWARLEPWADTWEALARKRFLAAYVRKSHEGRFLSANRDARTRLLEFFELDKALYELEYELTHRPDWIAVPARGISRLLERRATT